MVVCDSLAVYKRIFVAVLVAVDHVDLLPAEHSRDWRAFCVAELSPSARAFWNFRQVPLYVAVDCRTYMYDPGVVYRGID